MEITLRQSNIFFDKQIQFTLKQSKIKDHIWNIASAILFPIGLYRLSCYYVSKHIFSPFILASSSEYIKKKFEHAKLVKETDLTLFKDVVATRISHKLDGVQIRKEGNQKWLIYVLPTGSIWQQILETELLPLARESGRNVLCVNYRSTGANPINRPSSFNDLYEDVESALLTIEEDLGDDTVFYGHSLGCATALHLALKFGRRAVAQNTFGLFENLAEPYRKHLHSSTSRYLSKLIEEQQNNKLKFALIDTFLSLPHLVFRVTYFTLSLLDNILHLEGKNSVLDIREIGKTILIDTILTITGLVSLILYPCANRINQFNAELKSNYLSRSAPLTFISSSKFVWLAKKILNSSGWYVDNALTALKLGKDRVFVVQAPCDQKLESKYTLAYALANSDIPIHTFQDHELDTTRCHHDYLASPALERHQTDRELRKFLR